MTTRALVERSTISMMSALFCSWVARRFVGNLLPVSEGAGHAVVQDVEAFVVAHGAMRRDSEGGRFSKTKDRPALVKNS